MNPTSAQDAGFEGAAMIDHSNQKQTYEAVLYIRVSDKKQIEEGSGLDSQETRGREYARHLKVPVAAVFSDKGISGKLIDRDGVQDMLRFLKKPKNGVRYIVIIDDISRLARDIRVFLDLRDAIHDTGALLESPTMKFRENRDADGNMYEGIQALSAQHYREKVAETTRNRTWARLMAGYWVYTAPLGYKYVPTKTQGKILVRDEPVASIIQEALEGYASGRFDTQTEVQRFFESQPEFPMQNHGGIRLQKVTNLMTHPIYAGFVLSEKLNVALRKGNHPPIISLETFEKVQQRRKAGGLAPARKDISERFPLRGFVTCGDCEKPLRACESKSRTGKYHPYYLCHTKGCNSYGKSIRQGVIEGEFAELLKGLTPSVMLFDLVRDMFTNAWNQRLAQADEMRKTMRMQILKIEKQADKLMNHMAESTSDMAMAAFERKIAALEKDRYLASEKLEKSFKPKHTSAQMIEPALKFLAIPCKLWETGNIHMQKLVLRLAFAERLPYQRNEGYRTAKTTLPFNVLRDIRGGQCKMVPTSGIEPLASPLPRECSTPELRGRWRGTSLFFRALSMRILISATDHRAPP